MIFLKDKKAIDAEIERLRPTFEEAASSDVDHRVQSDAKWISTNTTSTQARSVHVGGEPKY